MFKLKEAFDKFQLTIPTRKTENWKYTPITKLLDAGFRIGHVGATGWSPSERPVADQTGRPTGSPYPRPMQLLTHPFAHLAIVVADQVKIIEIKESLSSPMKIDFINKESTAITVHQRIHVAENIQAEIIFNHISDDETACFTNIFTEIILEKNAKLNIYKNQKLNRNSFLIDLFLIEQSENSSLYSFTLDKGAALSRTDFIVNLNQPNSEASVHGLYYTAGEQIADHHSVIYHHAPHCHSSEHYRGILNDSSKAVFNGKIVIDQDAQKTSTQQLNKNILLSNKAEIDTKPELEIYANDVKAKHGATVGQLDDQALFYLMARGIEKSEAMSLLMAGFSKEVLLTIPNKEIQAFFMEQSQ